MSDLLQGQGIPFDIAVLALVVVSAVMSLGRGLIREASSIIAFIIGGISAALALRFLRAPADAIIPDNWPPITSVAILIGVGFLAAYALAAFLGARVSRLIHASPEIGLLDRLAGAAFGAVRGFLAAVLFVLLAQEVMPENGSLSAIENSRSFPMLNATAEWIRDTVPGFVERASEVIVPTESGEPGGG